MSFLSTGSGKTTLAQKLLNERITKDKVPCYYWSLKNTGRGNYYALFLQQFCLAKVDSQGGIVNTMTVVETLRALLSKLKEEHGAPSVLVIDDAQVNHYCQIFLIEATMH